MVIPSRILAAASVLFTLTVAGCSGDGTSNSCRRSSPAASGPGDASNYFPLTVGSTWFYDETTDEGGAPTRSRWRVEVTGTRAVGDATASVFAATSLDGASPMDEALFAKSPSGVTEFAGAGVEPPLDRVYPYQVITFPLAAGTTFEQVSCSSLDYGEDLDGDRRNEQLDLQSIVTVTGQETVDVPAGSFLAMRVETRVTAALRATSGQSASVVITEVDWFAPGVGRVRTSSTVSDGTFTSTSGRVLVGYAVEGRRGGLTRLATLATNLSPAISDTELPGRPALSFDGAGHLLVSVTSTTWFWEQSWLRGYVLAGDGSTLRQLAPFDRTGHTGRPAAAFNGANHLVASNLCASDCSTIVAQRITPTGDLLDGPGGFDITFGGGSAGMPALASNGDGWLVVWTTGSSLMGAQVSSAGTVLRTFELHGGAGLSWEPAVAFGSGVYLVAWVEGPNVVAKRVSSDGVVLDATPVAISTAPGDKSMGGVASDGTQFLVTWGDPRRGGTWMNVTVHDVYAARVAPDGTILDGPPDTGGIVVNAYPNDMKAYPRVAFDGSRFVVTWSINGFYGDVGIFAAGVTSDGRVLDGPTSGIGLVVAQPFNYASRYVHPMVAPAHDGQALIAWVDNTELSGTSKAVLGAWLAP